MHHWIKVYRHPVLLVCRVLLQITITPTFTDRIRLKSQTTQCFFRERERNCTVNLLCPALKVDLHTHNVSLMYHRRQKHLPSFCFQASEVCSLLNGIYTTRSHCWCTYCYLWYSLSIPLSDKNKNHNIFFIKMYLKTVKRHCILTISGRSIYWLHEFIRLFKFPLYYIISYKCFSAFKMLKNALFCCLTILKQSIVEQIFSRIHRNNVGRRTQFMFYTDLLCFFSFIVIPGKNKNICHPRITKETFQLLEIYL